MLAYCARRVPSAIVVLLLASVAIFAVLRLTPGDPAVTLAGPDANPTTVASIRTELGLDEPLPAQYLTWVTGLVTGDLGNSYVLGAPIATLIGRALGATVELTTAAVLLAVLLGLCLGTLAARPRGRFGTAILTAINTLSFSVPPFASGVLLVMVFAVWLRLLPAGGRVPLAKDPEIGVQYLLLPALCLALPASAVLARFLATSLREVLTQEYVRTAQSKGLRDRRILLRHAMPNALPPVVTVFGIQVGHLLGGAVIVEAIFAWPGLGQLVLQGVLRGDYLLVQDVLLLAVAAFIVIQTLTDVAQAALDPRIRSEL